MLKSIRHLCETLCSIPGPKSAKPLLYVPHLTRTLHVIHPMKNCNIFLSNYACRTGNNELLLFCLKLGGTVLQSVVPKRGMNCLHLVCQYGHMELLQTMLRVMTKAGVHKFLMSSDRCVCAFVCVRVCVCVCVCVHVCMCLCVCVCSVI